MSSTYTQLVMNRETLNNLPDIIIPEGFSLRCFKDGDEAVWEHLAGDMCGEGGFDKTIKNHRFFTPERVKMICYKDKPVATATAWDDEAGNADMGMVHMVAVDQEARGKGLGFIVTNAVLHHMKKEGKTSAYLTTDDFRIPAIKIYLKLGFKPDISQEGHSERWDRVIAGLK